MSTGSIGGATSAGVSNLTGAFGNLKSEDFIKVMVEQLSHQDPFEPQDSNALLEQLSSLRNIESQFKLQESISSLVLQNQMSAAGGLIGKIVAGLDDNNDTVQGLVTSVRLADNKVMLELDSGQTVAMDKIKEVHVMSNV